MGKKGWSARLSRQSILSLGICFLSLGACGHDPWVADGGWQEAPRKREDTHCDSFYLSKMLVDEPQFGPETHGLLLKGFYDRCDKNLSKGAPGTYKQLAKSIAIIYEYHMNGQMRLVEFNMDRHRMDDFKTEPTDSSTKFKDDRLYFQTQVFLKNTADPRPLIIVKCGLQCDLGTPTLKYMLSLLFDEGPFHVMLLPNITSKTFQKQNKIVSVGGFDEGRDILAVAKYIDSDAFPFRSKISRVHVAGISLGGHGALYAGLYNSFEKKPNGESYISSVFAGCPVVDLKGSVEGLYDGSTLGNIFEDYFWKQFKEVSYFVPVVGKMWELKDQRKKDLTVSQAVVEGALVHYKDMTADGESTVPAFKNVRVQNEVDLWHVNNFVNWSDLNTTPTFVWASKDDPIVKSPANVEKLIIKHGKQSNPHFQILLTDRGYHCGYTEAFTWKVAGETIRSLFVARSPELKEKRRLVTRALSFKNLSRPFPQLDNSRPRQKLQWQVPNSATGGELNLVQDFSDWCTSRLGCVDGKFYAQVDRTSFQGAEIPVALNDTQNQMITRWANANLFVSGHYLGFLDSKEKPVSVSWYSYDGETPKTMNNGLLKGQRLSPAFEPSISLRDAKKFYSEGLEEVLKINE
jgi:predicted alpha/beta-fold hydrolase